MNEIAKLKKPSTVMSVRVSKAFKKELNTYCKQKGISVSEYMQSGLETVGMMQLGEIHVNREAQRIITSITGGSLMATLSYKGIKYALKNKYTEKESNKWALIGAIALGLFSSVGIDSILSKLDNE